MRKGGDRDKICITTNSIENSVPECVCYDLVRGKSDRGDEKKGFFLFSVSDISESESTTAKKIAFLC